MLQLVRVQLSLSHTLPVQGGSHVHRVRSHDPWPLQSGSRHSTSWTHRAVETARGHRYWPSPGLCQERGGFQSVVGVKNNLHSESKGHTFDYHAKDSVHVNVQCICVPGTSV